MQERIRLPRPVQRGAPHHLEAPAGIKYPGRRVLFIDVQQALGMAAAEILQQGRTDAPAPQARLHEEHLHPLRHAAQKARRQAPLRGTGHGYRARREMAFSCPRRMVAPVAFSGRDLQPGQTYALHGRKIDARQSSPDGPQIVLRHEAVRGPHVAPPQAQQIRPVRRTGIAEGQSFHALFLAGTAPAGASGPYAAGAPGCVRRQCPTAGKAHPAGPLTGTAVPSSPGSKARYGCPSQGSVRKPHAVPVSVSNSSSTGHRRWCCPAPCGCPPCCAGSVPVP